MRRSIEAITPTLLVVALLLIPGSTWAQGSWSEKAPMPSPVVFAVGDVINGIFYVAGGDTGPNGVPNQATHTNIVQAYDPVSNSWTTQPPLGDIRAFASGAAI